MSAGSSKAFSQMTVNRSDKAGLITNLLPPSVIMGEHPPLDTTLQMSGSQTENGFDLMMTMCLTFPRHKYSCKTLKRISYSMR